MRRTLGVMTAALSAAAFLAAPAAAAPRQDPLQSSLDEVVAAGAVGAIAEVRTEHRPVWRGASGAAELGGTRPVPVHGRFRIGSITKTFLAVVVLQLVDEGKVRLDSAVLPGVTVRQLLNHTSGLYDVRLTLPMPPSAAFLANRWRTWTAGELIDRALAERPIFTPPGSAYAYANTNYLLLGRLVEEVTGSPYAKEIERRVTRPLGLRGTSLPGSDPRIRGPHPHGYVAGPDGLIDFTEWNPSVMGAAGEMISTTRDLNRFFAALLAGRLVPAPLLAAMKTPGRPEARYGLGLAWRDLTCGVRVYGNDGDALAYQSWSFSTANGSRQVTVAFTSGARRSLDDVVDGFVDRAVCG